jgi:methylmalonyl-CoA/ethylmalonyl-CoA epimerase
MENRIDHVGVLLPDFDSVRRVFGGVFGCETTETAQMPEMGIEFLWTRFGDMTLEFIRPTTDESEAADLVRTGHTGAHHFAIAVPDVHAALSRYQESGISALSPEPMIGVRGKPVAFLDPADLGGLLIEVVEQG